MKEHKGNMESKACVWLAKICALHNSNFGNYICIMWKPVYVIFRRKILRISHYTYVVQEILRSNICMIIFYLFWRAEVLWLNNQADISIFWLMCLDLMTSKTGWGKSNPIKPLEISYSNTNTIIMINSNYDELQSLDEDISEHTH